MDLANGWRVELVESSQGERGVSHQRVICTLVRLGAILARESDAYISERLRAAR